ncbi:mitochondrial iron-sulfur cluster biosynthesis Isa1 (Isca1) [Andalucia godoyi]|uniref:Mitochondrial iron-sulfur cluster biosynthesis Isa1 (Isca1) n=1 Tax=Andalucia godoyi TaxID=505711 RepID=A0A8K0F0I8_ANDGO|nr:mitochondrial iron-sulfur cluster biosynthesis Isa1 (Isca1) [Andalucia godoyi]|eukprot:ANDGO_01522.mRNA.1 mitochondrial iron-sulfur cluster biosynthesis Isa1 (Isca1)
MSSRLQRSLGQMMKITDAASGRLKDLISSRHDPSILGIRIGVKRRGCNGLSYTMDYAKDKQKFENAIDASGVTVLVDPKSEMYLIGMEIDYQENDLAAEFVFKNPNAKGTCGCGESFHVQETKT